MRCTQTQASTFEAIRLLIMNGVLGAVPVCGIPCSKSAIRFTAHFGDYLKLQSRLLYLNACMLFLGPI